MRVLSRATKADFGDRDILLDRGRHSRPAWYLVGDPSGDSSLGLLGGGGMLNRGDINRATLIPVGLADGIKLDGGNKPPMPPAPVPEKRGGRAGDNLGLPASETTGDLGEAGHKAAPAAPASPAASLAPDPVPADKFGDELPDRGGVITKVSFVSDDPAPADEPRNEPSDGGGVITKVFAVLSELVGDPGTSGESSTTVALLPANRCPKLSWELLLLACGDNVRTCPSKASCALRRTRAS